MTAYQLFQLPKAVPLSTGVVMPGAKVSFFLTGTSTPTNVWTTAARNVAHTQPVVADASGVLAPIYLDPEIVYKATITSSADVLLYTVDPINDNVLSQSSVGAALFPISTAESNAGLTDADITDGYQWGDVRRYGAVADGSTDCSPAIQAAYEQSRRGGYPAFVPSAQNFYRCNTAIDCDSGGTIRGDGLWPQVKFYGVNGFVIAAGASNVVIDGLALFLLTSGGGADPQTFDGISSQGTNPSHVNFCRFSNLYMQGWNRCIDLQFTWDSRVQNVVTLNCNKGVRLLGQSVGIHINDCRIVADEDGILGEVSGGLKGEGLRISNTIIADAQYALRTDNAFLEIEVVNCDFDQIADTACQIVNCTASSFTGTWMYAANYGIRFIALGSPGQQGNTITGCRIETTAASSRPISIGSNNVGVSIVGGSLVCPASSRCLVVEADAVNVSIVGTNLVNGGTSPSILADSVANNFIHADCTGEYTVQWTTYPTIASAAALVIPRVGNRFRVSGTTNITSIDATCDFIDREITLIFEGALTVTDGSNLILNGNFVTTALDTLTLVPGGGGNWFEKSRSVN